MMRRFLCRRAALGPHLHRGAQRIGDGLACWLRRVALSRITPIAVTAAATAPAAPFTLAIAIGAFRSRAVGHREVGVAGSCCVRRQGCDKCRCLGRRALRGVAGRGVGPCLVAVASTAPAATAAALSVAFAIGGFAGSGIHLAHCGAQCAWGCWNACNASVGRVQADGVTFSPGRSALVLMFATSATSVVAFGSAAAAGSTVSRRVGAARAALALSIVAGGARFA